MIKVGDKVKYRTGHAIYEVIKITNSGKMYIWKGNNVYTVATTDKLVKVGGLKIGDKITKDNYKLLRYGDVLKVDDSFYPSYLTWKELSKEDGWFEARETSTNPFNVSPNLSTKKDDTHSLKDFGIIPNTYNSFQCYYMGKLDLTKGESKMTKYEEFVKRIKNLNDGWTKEADDIINEMIPDWPLTIKIRKDSAKGQGCIILDSGKSSCAFGLSIDKYFYYNSQCEKNKKFKELLLFILDKSDIKKETAKDLKIKEILAEIDKLQNELLDLK